ncbi:hypothetical protein [Fluoribacter dumoffii]|uniref:Uncharacterized protein n=1 Tax=Fluoribacter dumoffii TaxID=463 RepID=A0A377GDR5_9GAMM|nr:hypothetical protein [Fluoribacter dumoffii]KTC91250.1 NHL repeat protein [Fluoribacter dumoffii NY 23]STO22947.1 Uncharacterised protein [Fluoribacter dumoffii]
MKRYPLLFILFSSCLNQNAIADTHFTTTEQVSSPLWTFIPDANFPPEVTVSPTRTATVKYTITNQSKKTKMLVMSPIIGINQVTSGVGNCKNPFSLSYKQSCTLTLKVIGSELVKNVSGGPVVCNQGNRLQCYQPASSNSLNITKAEMTRFYVNGRRLANGNGSSWPNAFNNLESALQAANADPGPVEIWVAQGVYKPTRVYAPQGVVGGAYGINTPKLRTFNLPSDTAIYGGFSGRETSRGQRNGQLFPTILCGDMTSTCLTPYVVKSNHDRVWHVLMAGSDVSPGKGVKNIKLDSLIVRGGYAVGPDSGVLGPRNILESLDYEHAAGGGLLARYGSTIELSNMLFELNISDGSNATVTEILDGEFLSLASGGGAVAAIDTDTAITIKHSKFINNLAVFPGGSGGALENLIDATYTITSSQFEQNIAFRNGGAIRGKDGGNINIASSNFKGNVLNGPVPDASGGALGVINTNLSVSDSTFTQNQTTLTGFGGGAIFFHIPFNDGTPYFLTVVNSKFISNVASAFGGGGINVFGVLPNPGSRAKIMNSEFTNNSGGVGGAIYLDSIATTVTQSIFAYNQAELEGGGIFASNYADAVFASPVKTLAEISNNKFFHNTIEGVPASAVSPLFFFNSIANFFSGGSSSVTTMAPGGGAIAVEFSGNAKIVDNIFEKNTALKKPLGEDNRGGAILVGGSAGSPLAMNLTHACISSNKFFGNQANIDNNIALYNPGNIPGGVTIDACISPIKKLQ